jgi:hypothetical protein
MAKDQIIITVTESADPQITVEVEGFVGKGCTALTKGLQDAIGTTVNEEFKPEYHNIPARSSVSQQQQQRS